MKGSSVQFFRGKERGGLKGSKMLVKAPLNQMRDRSSYSDRMRAAITYSMAVKITGHK
jgi:hypothetical protein